MDISDLRQRAIQIRDEQKKSANTAYRVGSFLLDLLESHVDMTSVNNVQLMFGAVGDGMTDDTSAIQAAIDDAYANGKAVYIPAGVYIITRTIFVYDGTYIKGDGIYNTILKTPFGKSATAKACLDVSKGGFTTAVSGSPVMEFDYAEGHNRFYIGDGNVGYYDSDRDTNPDHPLYWPSDGSEEWIKWYSERATIQSQGRFVGKTGREGYGGGMFKCSQNPNLFHTSVRTSSEYSPVRPGGHVWTGVRNVRISSLQINTNSSDRGKDTAVNFAYTASGIPKSIRETYDSSVLNCYLDNLYLFSIGSSGIKAYRAVDFTVINCYVRQCAEYGMYFNGVTSISIIGCYANSCLEGGYYMKGVNYSSIMACASDSCSIGYNLHNCNGITLSSCGAEATRYQKAEEPEEEDPYKGRAFSVVNSKGVTLSSCYAMTSHPKIYGDLVSDLDEDDFDADWLKSRHVFISSSHDVNVSNCYFKCFQRIRTSPYRDADNNKVNAWGGTYDPTVAGSRYWQVQNYLVGAQFEVRGEDSKISIVSSSTSKEMASTSEIRTSNLDLLDPGTVSNPLASSGYDTAGKTLSGGDGNGGWTVPDGSGGTMRVTMANFEFVFPINAKSTQGKREFWWRWRASLLLVRRHTDESLAADHPSRYFGYEDVLDTSGGVSWADVVADSSKMSAFLINAVDDYSDTAFIDGDDGLFGHGTLFYESLVKPVAYAPRLMTPLPGLVRAKDDGCRTIINANAFDGFPAKVIKSAVSVIGNESREAGEDTGYEGTEAGNVFTLMSMEQLSQVEKEIFGIYDIKGNVYFTVNSRRRGFLSARGHNFLSSLAADLTNISQLPTSASLEECISVLNQVIERLIVHGLASAPSGDITFTFVSVTSYDTSIVIAYSITSERTLYTIGAAYSTTNASPTVNQGKVESEDVSVSGGTYTGTVTVPRSDSTVQRYVRLYAETSAAGGASNREYSQTNLVGEVTGGGSDEGGETGGDEITFTISNVTLSDTAIVVGYTITSGQTLYTIGAAYSTTNSEPTVNQGKTLSGDTSVSGNTYTGTVTVPRSDSTVQRYVRLFAETSASGGASSRVYGSSTLLGETSGGGSDEGGEDDGDGGVILTPSITSAVKDGSAITIVLQITATKTGSGSGQTGWSGGIHEICIDVFEGGQSPPTELHGNYTVPSKSSFSPSDSLPATYEQTLYLNGTAEEDYVQIYIMPSSTEDWVTQGMGASVTV